MNFFFLNLLHETFLLSVKTTELKAFCELMYFTLERDQSVYNLAFSSIIDILLTKVTQSFTNGCCHHDLNNSTKNLIDSIHF